MVAQASEAMPPQPEGDQSEIQAGEENPPKSHPIGSLGRQSSIYSLTLDEFQHALCESGKNFGSMNMDEFLTSIWSAEENQAINSAADNNNNSSNDNLDGDTKGAGHLTSDHAPEKAIITQPSLPRQGSLTLPAPLSRKTVDEVWSEIHKYHQNQRQSDRNGMTDIGGNVPRQPTFGEMTLEDFLIKAGVVREQVAPIHTPLPSHHQFHQQQQQYALYPNNTMPIVPSFIPRPIMATSAGGGAANAPAYQPMPKTGGTGGDLTVFTANGKTNPGYPVQPQSVCYGSRIGNGAVAVAVSGYVASQPMGMAAPVSPVSSDGIGGQMDNSSSQFGMEMGGMRSRKRNIGSGSVDRVVERRQRRMIKNRESAARSRARKQAYTVELEAELNQLKEENAHLKQTVLELQKKRKHQYFEEMRLRAAQTEVSRGTEKLKIRRNLSSPW